MSLKRKATFSKQIHWGLPGDQGRERALEGNDRISRLPPSSDWLWDLEQGHLLLCGPLPPLWLGQRVLLSLWPLEGQGCSDSGSQIRWQQTMASFLPATYTVFFRRKMLFKVKKDWVFLKLIFVGVDLLYSVVLVSAMPQSESAIHIHISPLWSSFPFRVPCAIQWLTSVIYFVHSINNVYTYQSQWLNSSPCPHLRTERWHHLWAWHHLLLWCPSFTFTPDTSF